VTWFRWLWSFLAGHASSACWWGSVGGPGPVSELLSDQAAVERRRPPGPAPAGVRPLQLCLVSEYPVILWNTVVVAVLATILAVAIGFVMGPGSEPDKRAGRAVFEQLRRGLLRSRP